MQILPASVRPAFGGPLTREESAQLRQWFESRAATPPALPRPLNPEPVVANLPAIVAARYVEGAPLSDPALPRWLTRPASRDRETGAYSLSACIPARADGVESRGVASKHVSVLTRAELHQSPNSLDLRQLRAAVKNSLRSIFPRQSNLRKCGIRRHAGGVEVRVRDRREDDGGVTQTAYVAGLVRCGSVWSCPTCASTISGQRADVVTTVVEAHRERTKTDEHPGGAVYMLTLTARHNVSMPLKALRRTVSKGLQKLQAGKGWANLKEQMGFVGSIAAREVTIGGNGYHPHLHILLALDRPLTVSQVDEIETAIWFRWCSALSRVTEFAEHEVIPNRARGAVLTVCHQADYIQKLGLAAELTGGAEKKAHGENRTPFQVAVDWCRDHDRRDAAIFRAFSRGMKGARQLTWSRGKEGANDLRQIYAAELLAVKEANNPPKALTGFESEAELLARAEKEGTTVARPVGRQWDAFARVMRAAGVDPEHVMKVAAESDGAGGVESALGVALAVGRTMVAGRPWLKKWLRWLSPPDPLPALA